MSELYHSAASTEFIAVARPPGTPAEDTGASLLDHWASYAGSPATLARLPPADFAVAGLPHLPCAWPFCSVDGRFYPSRCGGDSTGQRPARATERKSYRVGPKVGPA